MTAKETHRWPTAPWLGEVLLLAVTLVTAAGFARLFADRSTIVPLVVAAVTAHLVVATARRRRWRTGPTVLVLTAALALQVSVVLYPHTSLGGLPTPDTVGAMTDDLRQGWEVFGTVRAPAPPDRGLLLAASAALWVVAGLADWAAFRRRALAEAIAPAASLFALTALLGRGRGGVALAALLVAAVLAFVSHQRSARTAHEDAWVGGRAPTATLARSGTLVALVVAAVSAVMGPALPTAGEEALVGWRGEPGRDGRTTVSPLVDIKSRLVEQGDEIAFTVEAERGTYWRLATLSRFDGRFWAYEERFDDVDEELPGNPFEATTERLLQAVTIGDLDTIYVPAAGTPTEVVDSTVELLWSPELATLIVAEGDSIPTGSRVEVESATPAFTPDQLDAAQPDDLPDDVAEATVVPAGLPTTVAETAAAVVAGADDTPYARARALQDWFRSKFTYDLGQVSGHGGTAIEAFLDARRGYCEQFAGTFAAMARTLGLPSRVAVGYTMGDPTADGTGFTVRGRNAHAWPEVWIAGAGWVPFEPTPGAGMPGAERYTGVEPGQPGEVPPPGPDTTSTTTPAEPPTSTTDPAPAPPTTATPPDGPPTTPPDTPADGGGTRDVTTADDGGPAWPMVLLLVVAAGLGLLALDVAVVAAVRARRARAPGGGSVPARVRAAWGRTIDALGLVGVAPVAGETEREFARRAGPDLGDAGPALTRLAGMVTVTTWAPSTARVRADIVDQADALAHHVAEQVHEHVGWRARVRSALDPRVAAIPLTAARDRRRAGRR